MDYKICMLPLFLFSIQISDFYAKLLSLYAKISVLLSKWPAFYSRFLVWVCTCERRPFLTLYEVCVCCSRKVLSAKVVVEVD